MADTQGGTTESDQAGPIVANDQTTIKDTPQEEVKAEVKLDEKDPEPSAPAEPADRDGASAGETKVETAEATNGSVKREETTATSTSAKETAQSATPNKRGGPHNRGAPHKTFRDRYRENIKFDPSTQQPTDDPEQIRKQVEFYFSDSNLPMDKFLIGKVGGAKNDPVEISTIHSFGRMRRFQPFSAVVAALKDSTELDVIEDKYVQRKVPIDEAALGKSVEEGQKWVEDKALHRSIYAKGFDEETPTTQFDIEAFFSPYGPTNAIRLRRTWTGKFKQSVFVEFSDEATQQAFMAIEPKPKWKGTTELLWLSKHDYVEGKKADIASGKIKPNPHGYTPGGKRKHDGGGSDEWKKRREDDQRNGFRGGRGRGHSNGRGGRGGNGRGGRGGRREQRDPHKIPTIGTSTPESAGEVASSNAAPAAPTSTDPPTADNAATTIKTEAPASAKTEAPASTKTEAPVSSSISAPTTTDDAPSKKRARDDNGAGDQGESRKKVDTKEVQA